jgi:phage-related minor tail protein
MTAMNAHRPDSARDAAASLRREIAALQHELRRVGDRLESNPSHALEQRARQLRASIALCERDLAREGARDRSCGE